MKTAVKIIAVAAGLALVVLLAMFIRKSTEELDVSTENDIRIEVKNDLPDGLNVFTDGDGILPPLWKVEKDGAVIYMMGSVHAADKSLYPLDGRVKKAYEECEKVAVEHRNLTLSDFVSSGSEKTYPETYEEGDELKNHLSEKRYKLLTDAASKAGYDLNKLDKMQLWAVYTGFSAIVGSEQNTSTEKSDGGTQYGIDTVFQKLAVNEKKERLNIETDEEKAAFYPEMPEDVLGLLIESRLTDEEDLSEILAAYRTGDLEKLFDLSYGKDLSEDVPQETLDRQYEYMIVNRNRKMADRALEYLNDGGKVFFIAGSAHFCGSDGIPALLETAGCTVTRI